MADLHVKPFKSDEDDFQRVLETSETLTYFATLSKVAKESSLTILTCIAF